MVLIAALVAVLAVGTGFAVGALWIARRESSRHVGTNRPSVVAVQDRADSVGAVRSAGKNRVAAKVDLGAGGFFGD